MQSGQKIPKSLLPDAVITGAQIRAARALLNWSINQLAASAKVTRSTIRNAERSDAAPALQASKMASIIMALQGGGVCFFSRQHGAFAHGVGLVADLPQPTDHVEPQPFSLMKEHRPFHEQPRGGLLEWERRLSVRQVKAARSMLGWSQTDLAHACSVSAPTVKALEANPGMLGGKPQTARAIRDALERAGIEFQPEAEKTGEGVRLRKGCRSHETTRRHRRRRVA